MKIYHGRRTRGFAIVEVSTPDLQFSALPKRLDLANHSPTGFEWNYGGSGPAQLALALLADCLGDEVALTCYQSFKWDVVAGLPREWELSEDQIKSWHAAHLSRRAAEMEA